MKHILITILLLLNLQANDAFKDLSFDSSFMEKFFNDVNTTELIEAGTDFLEALSEGDDDNKTTELKNKLKDLVNSARDTIEEEKTVEKKVTPKVIVAKENDDYDTSFCRDPDDLKVWRKYSKSADLKMQQLHALFLGLCMKVEKKDIPTDVAQFIFKDARDKLYKK